MTDALLHDERAHQDFAEPADGITAHELAHQWFGDLLTCREWSHGWLNESFATYFSALYVEHAHGSGRLPLRRCTRTLAGYFGGGRLRATAARSCENVFAEPIDIFDRHLYERGSQVLDMLRYHPR